METKQLTSSIRNDSNRALCLAGIIPVLVFTYLIAGKGRNISTFLGEAGYIILATIGVFIMGIVVGRKMIMAVTFKLIEDNQKILNMQQELLEKNRLAAITETVLTLGDQVNNPLLVISGNLELLNMEIRDVQMNEKINNRIQTMRTNFQKIREVTDKMSKLTKPETVSIHGNTRMIDLDKSV